jgi:hypothetical protein
MKKFNGLLLLLFLLIPIVVWGQETIVEDYDITGEYLNVTILAGQAGWTGGNHMTYVLRKGGKYAWNASLTLPSGADISFRSDYGTGDTMAYPNRHLNPKIYEYGVIGQLMSITGDNVHLSMNNIYVACYNELDPTTLAAANTMFLRCQTAGGLNTRIIIDSCIIKSIAGQIVRTDVSVGIVKITNSIMADMGHPTSNFGAGKFIDARNTLVDTIWVENNTLVNLYDRVIRHYQATGGNYLANFIFNHNTIISSMSYHGFLSLGLVNTTGGGTFQIRDNLLLDHFALGMDTAINRQLEFGDPAELDRYNKNRLAWVLTNPNNVVQWDIRNNYYGVSDSGQAILDLGADPAFWGPLYRSVDLDSIGGDPNDHNYLTRNMNAVLALQGKDTLNTFRKVYFKFEEYPGLMTELIRWVLNGSMDQKNKPTLNTSPIWLNNGSPDYHRHVIEYYADTLNCDFYCDTDLSAASTDGIVVGDPRWNYIGPVSVSDPVAQIPSKFDLNQNYPNPFNPATSIKYTIPTANIVTLKVFNLLGQVVATLVDERQEANTYVKEFDASRLSSGIYFYKINAGSFNATRKMILMK